MSQHDDSASRDGAAKWDLRYRDAAAAPRPAAVLSEHTHLLPGSGQALDLACGLGANALLLARHGLETWAWDRSGVAIEQLAAACADLPLHAEQRDVLQRPPAPASFDVVVVTRFLERSLFPHLLAALRPAGLLFYQTFIAAKSTAVGPANPDYLLGDNELLQRCAGLRILVYREEGRVGDTERGFRNEAMLIGQRR